MRCDLVKDFTSAETHGTHVFAGVAVVGLRRDERGPHHSHIAPDPSSAPDRGEAGTVRVRYPGTRRRARALLGEVLHGRGAVPVSYTHLRAHETRHDLVCRLLL